MVLDAPANPVPPRLPGLGPGRRPGPWPSAADPRSPGSPRAGEYGPFKMGLQSYSLRHYKAEEALAKTKELGVHYWESYSAHTPPDPAKAAESKSLAAASGVEVIGFGVSGFTKDHEKNRKLFEFGKATGRRLPLGRPRRPTPSTASTS